MPSAINLDLTIKLAGVLVAAIGFAFGLWQYRRQQIWKIREFVAAKVQEFYAKRENQTVINLLCWEHTDAELFPERKEDADRIKRVTSADVYAALAINDPNLTDVQRRIVDYVDVFLNELGLFNQFVKAGLFSFRDVMPYIRYPISLILGRAKNDATTPTHDLSGRLRDFITYWEYLEVAELLNSEKSDFIDIPKPSPMSIEIGQLSSSR